MTNQRHAFLDNASPVASMNRVFVRDMRVEARIGYYAHEKGQTQPLVVEVELAVLAPHFHDDALDQTVDYDMIAAHVRDLAAGHIDLVETFAERLASLCLDHPLADAVRIRIDKPRAIPGALAGVEIVRRR